MKTWQRLAAAGTLMAVMLASIAVPASAATRTTRWVDNDGRAGPSGCGSSQTAYKKIQKAIDASNADDTVVVCPATYSEQLTISGNRDGLTLRSSTDFKATIVAPVSLSGPLGLDAQILIDHVDDVTIRGFRVQSRTTAPCESVGAMVLVIGSQRASIRGNRLSSPGAGRLSQVCSADYGVMVLEYLSGGAPRRTSATIGFNVIRDVMISIYAQGIQKRTHLNVVHNSLRFYYGAPPAGPIKPRVDASGTAAVMVVGNISGTIEDNVIQGSTNGPNTPNSSEFAFGVFAVGTSGSHGQLVIEDNLIRRVLYGVFTVLFPDATIRRNTIRNTVIGIYLSSTTGTEARRNEVRSKSVGILVDSGSTGNVFRGNSVAGNGGICIDNTPGGGSYGTANTWIGNTATVSDSPNGICPHP